MNKFNKFLLILAGILSVAFVLSFPIERFLNKDKYTSTETETNSEEITETTTATIEENTSSDSTTTTTTTVSETTTSSSTSTTSTSSPPTSFDTSTVTEEESNTTSSISENTDISNTSKNNTDTAVPPDSEEWLPDMEYLGGSEVTYNGKRYKSRWWTKGDNPEESYAKDPEYGPWELIS